MPSCTCIYTCFSSFVGWSSVTWVQATSSVSLHGFSDIFVAHQDPIILSGTAFLAYFTRVTGISPPTAWVFAEFIAANVASAVLVSSNPTNVLISGVSATSSIAIDSGIPLQFPEVSS